MSGNFYDTWKEGLTGFREEVTILVEGNHLYVILVVVKVKNSGKLVLKTRVVVVEDHPVAASQHDQMGGNAILLSAREGSRLELDEQLAARIAFSPFGTCNVLVSKLDGSRIDSLGGDVSIDEVVGVCFSSTYKSVWDLARHDVREHIFDGLQVVGMCKAHLGTRGLRTENVCGGYVFIFGRFFIVGRFVVVVWCIGRRRRKDGVRDRLSRLWGLVFFSLRGIVAVRRKYGGDIA